MVIFTLYGYIGMATFYLVSQWLAQYGQFVVGLPYASAIKLLSIYTVGSLVCVFVTAAFVKEVFSSAIAMIIYTGLSMISLLLGVSVPDADDGDRLCFLSSALPPLAECCAGCDNHGDELPERKGQSNRHLLHCRQYRQLHDPVDHRKAFADQYCQHYVV